MKTLIYILSFIVLISCDCRKFVSGVVLDKSTHEPIQGVKVCFHDQPTTFALTDSLGNYTIYYVNWGLGCYTKNNKKVVAEKKAYKKSDAVPAMNTIELARDTLMIK